MWYCGASHIVLDSSMAVMSPFKFFIFSWPQKLLELIDFVLLRLQNPLKVGLTALNHSFDPSYISHFLRFHLTRIE